MDTCTDSEPEPLPGASITWTLVSPTQSGWYWYRERGKNLDLPMPAWVFQSRGSGWNYASLFAVHESPDFRNVKQIEEYPGQWAGPLAPPQ